MKAHTVYLFLAFCLVVISCSKDDTNDAYDIYADPYYKLMLEVMNMPRPEGSYTYPIIPGTDEWRKFDSRQEKEDACQVPPEVLRKQSTQAVIQALWEYPLRIDYLAWDIRQKGYIFAHERLNAYQELLKRSDAGTCLLERYMIIKEALSGEPIAHYLLEMHLAQEHFFSLLTPMERKQTVKRTLEIIRIRKQLPDFYSKVSDIEISYYLMGRIMRYDKYVPFMELLSNNPEWTEFFDNQNYYVLTDEKIGMFTAKIAELAEDYSMN